MAPNNKDGFEEGYTMDTYDSVTPVSTGPASTGYDQGGYDQTGYDQGGYDGGYAAAGTQRHGSQASMYSDRYAEEDLVASNNYYAADEDDDEYYEDYYEDDAEGNRMKRRRKKKAAKEGAFATCIMATLIGLFILFTILSSLLVIKPMIFGPDGYVSPYNSLQPRVDKLDEYQKKEAKLFPDFDAAQAEYGSCNNTNYNQAREDFYVQYDQAMWDAVDQVVGGACDTAHLSPATCTDYYAGTIDYESNPETSAILPVTIPTDTGETDIYNQISQKVKDRYNYDRNYINNKLRRVNAVNFDTSVRLTAFSGISANMNGISAGAELSPTGLADYVGLIVAANDVLAPSEQIDPNIVTDMNSALGQVKTMSNKLSTALDAHNNLVNDFDSEVPQLGLFGSDYNPPPVFDEKINSSLEPQMIEANEAKVGEVNTYEAGELDPPVVIPEVHFPSFIIVLNILTAFDVAFLIIDTLTIAYRLKYKALGGFKVKRSIGLSVDGNLKDNAVAKAKHYGLKCLAAFNPLYILALVGIVIYCICLNIYAQSLYTPLRNENSYIYTAPGFYSTSNLLWEYYLTNGYNANLTSISNECVEEQSAQSNDLSALGQEMRLNVSRLPTWGEDTWSDQWAMTEEVFDATGYDQTFTSPDPDALCDCPLAYYNMTYSEERAQAAQDADVQIYKIVNAYVLKFHFLVAILVATRIMRAMTLKLFILYTSRFRTPRFQAEITMPADLKVMIQKGEMEDTDILRGVDYTAELKKFIKGRAAAMGFAVTLQVFLFIIIIICLVWNRQVTKSLYE